MTCIHKRSSPHLFDVYKVFSPYQHPIQRFLKLPWCDHFGAALCWALGNTSQASQTYRWLSCKAMGITTCAPVQQWAGICHLSIQQAPGQPQALHPSSAYNTRCALWQPWHQGRRCPSVSGCRQGLGCHGVVKGPQGHPAPPWPARSHQ